MLASDHLSAVVRDCLAPERFSAAAGYRVHRVHVPSEEVYWEIFLGHLLDAARTREVARFESWNLERSIGDGPTEPLLSVKIAADRSRIYVVRRLKIHGWETYEDPPGVIHTRSAQTWSSELVGTIDLQNVADRAQLEGQLEHYLTLALVGTSRLPITSLESPMPDFVLGRLAYLPRGTHAASEFTSRPIRLAGAAWQQRLDRWHRAKLLEAALRAADPEELAGLAATAASSMISGGELLAIIRTLFQHLALSPYTHFVDNLIGWLAQLEEQGSLSAASHVDLISFMLRQLVRHLTAFDLVMFHSFGANYPDALLLDSLLASYARLIERHHSLFQAGGGASEPRARLRRRALRQGCMIRKMYEGHAVPDAPTSPGENQQVLPEPLVRVPEEQIAQPRLRRKRLYDKQSLDQLLGPDARHLLQQSVNDLAHAAELQELGVALYLDRPLGAFKQPGETDRTPLLSYVAFSRRTAQNRLQKLRSWQWLDDAQRKRYAELLDEQSPKGLEASRVPVSGRPGVISLEDAQKAALDFRFLYTTQGSLEALLAQYDWSLLEQSDRQLVELLQDGRSLLVRSTAPMPGRPFLALYDHELTPRFLLGVVSGAYVEHAGVELLIDGLLAWPADAPHDSPVHLPVVRK